MTVDYGQNRAERGYHCGFMVFLRQLRRRYGAGGDSFGSGAKIVSACKKPLAPK
tara:strand:- start:265 stop:426 length:162 start_codon:yes stop_codon:yes gene_type:complete